MAEANNGYIKEKNEDFMTLLSGVDHGSEEKYTSIGMF
jgi:hypothetical protein